MSLSTLSTLPHTRSASTPARRALSLDVRRDDGDPDDGDSHAGMLSLDVRRDALDGVRPLDGDSRGYTPGGGDPDDGDSHAGMLSLDVRRDDGDLARRDALDGDARGYAPGGGVPDDGDSRGYTPGGGVANRPAGACSTATHAGMLSTPGQCPARGQRPRAWAAGADSVPVGASPCPVDASGALKGMWIPLSAPYAPRRASTACGRRLSPPRRPHPCPVPCL